MLGSHYHEPECPACGFDLDDDDAEDVDDDGRPYCGACGHDLSTGRAWTTSSTASGLVIA